MNHFSDGGLEKGLANPGRSQKITKNTHARRGQEAKWEIPIKQLFMTLAEKFGWRVPMAKYLKSLPESCPDASAPNFGDLIWSYKSWHDNVADCAVLEEDSQQAIRSAKEVVRASLDHFFGDWRQKSGRENGDPYDWHNNGPMALFWASFLNDWKAIASLSQFPRLPTKWEWPEHAY